MRLLVPGPLTDHPWVRQAARRFFGKMLYNDVRIFEFQPRVLHAKMIVCDDWVSIGSSNLDRWSFKWNLEANQEIADAVFAAAAAAVYVRDCGQSKELDHRSWMRRGRVNRLWETHRRRARPPARAMAPPQAALNRSPGHFTLIQHFAGQMRSGTTIEPHASRRSEM